MKFWINVQVKRYLNKPKIEHSFVWAILRTITTKGEHPKLRLFLNFQLQFSTYFQVWHVDTFFLKVITKKTWGKFLKVYIGKKFYPFLPRKNMSFGESPTEDKQHFVCSTGKAKLQRRCTTILSLYFMRI